MKNLLNLDDAEGIVRDRFENNLSDRFSTHLPVLVSALSRTSGSVLELGVGMSSTPVLHQLCKEQKRFLISYEQDEEYYNFASFYQGRFHTIIYIKNYDFADIEQEWGVVFIDHHPGSRRLIDIRRVSNYADYIVCHDSEPKADGYRQYTKIYPLFKYQWEYTKFSPQTVVLSNRREWEKI